MAIFNGGKHLFLYLNKNTTSHYSFSILIDRTPYFVGIIRIVDDMDSLFIRQGSKLKKRSRHKFATSYENLLATLRPFN